VDVSDKVRPATVRASGLQSGVPEDGYASTGIRADGTDQLGALAADAVAWHEVLGGGPVS
jgi:hypothetical protein